MLISVSGSQGSGKSTILRAIKDAGFNTVERKTSRSILTDWNLTLQDVNNDADLTVKFQEEIIKRKFEDEREARESSDIWFTERTFADLFTYCLVSLGKDNNRSSWLNTYYNQCMSMNQHYKLVYFLRAGRFVVEHDGVRGSNHHYSRMVDITMLDITQQMVHNSRLTIIETPDLFQRVSMITEQTKSII